MTQDEESILAAERSIRYVQEEINNLIERHKYKLQAAHKLLQQNSLFIDAVKTGGLYVKCSQEFDLMFIKNGFTVINDLQKYLGHDQLDILVTRPEHITLGYRIYKIAENGILDLIDSNIDSSD